jgi:hypothetical protein
MCTTYHASLLSTSAILLPLSAGTQMVSRHPWHLRLHLVSFLYQTGHKTILWMSISINYNPPGAIGKERSNACIQIHALRLGHQKEGKELCCNHEHEPFHPGKQWPRPLWTDTGHTTCIYLHHFLCNGCLPLTHPLLLGKEGKELGCNVEHKASLPGKPSLRSWPLWMDPRRTSVHPRQPSCNGCLRFPHPLPTGKVGKEWCCPLGCNSVLTSAASDAFLFASGCEIPGALSSAPGVPSSTFPFTYEIRVF